MTARALFTVILRSFGLASILLGVNVIGGAILLIVTQAAWMAAMFFSAPDNAGGSVVHLNAVFLLWGLMQILIGTFLLRHADRIAARFYSE
jgi:hypothetical protein